MRRRSEKRHNRALSVGLPSTLAGSIALALAATPAAYADDGERLRSPDAFGLRMTTVDRANESIDSRPLLGRAGFATGYVHHTEPAPATYTVVSGDTVSGIAQRFGLRTDEILASNGLLRSSVIFPGQVLRLTQAVTAPVPSAPAPAVGYVVAAGDTLSGIARAHGISLETLFAANGLGWQSIIYPGQSVSIPGASAPAASPAPVAAPTPPAATASGEITVVAGDTLFGIARRHGVSVQDLFAVNGLDSSSIIYPGQRIGIPGAAAPAAVEAAPAAVAADPTTGLDAEQAANARLIISIGRELGVPDRGIAIALGTAMQESWLRNLDWGDSDSLGLFQQRPSTGWGTDAEVRDAARSTRAFFGGAYDPNGNRTRGLLDFAGWQDMSFAQAAQSVQRSAYPDRYTQWEQPAFAWLAALG